MILGFSKPNLLARQLHRVWASSLLWTLGSLCMYHMKTYFVQSDEYEYIIRLPSDVYVQYEYYGEHWKWTTQSTTLVPLDHTWSPNSLAINQQWIPWRKGPFQQSRPLPLISIGMHNSTYGEISPVPHVFSAIYRGSPMSLHLQTTVGTHLEAPSSGSKKNSTWDHAVDRVNAYNCWWGCISDGWSPSTIP